MAEALDWADLQAKALQGHDLSNQAIAGLLPLLAAGALQAAALEASGALRYLGKQDSLQQRMGAQIQASLRARQGKRPRLEDAEEAGINQGGGGGVSLFYPGKQGPGNDTVFHPPRPEAPTMASRRFSYLGIDPAQQQQYEDLMSRARRLDRRDARRRQLTTSAEELPGTFKWKAGEFQQMLLLPEDEQIRSSITAAQRADNLLWLTLAVSEMPDLTPGRAIVQVCGVYASVNGYRTVKRVEPEHSRIAISGVAAAPALDVVPAGACIRATHAMDESLRLYYFRIEGAPALPQQQAAMAAATAMPPPPAALPLPGLGTQMYEAAAAGGAGSSGAGAEGAGGTSGLPGMEAEFLDADASADKHFKSATLGQGQMVQAPPGVNLPTTPALDVRNDAVLRRDLFVLGDLYTPGGTVTALNGALQLICRLNAVEYCWASDPGGQRIAGFLAQEMKGAVHEAEDGTLFVAITKLLPYAAAAIKELETRLEQLEVLVPAVLAGAFHILVEASSAATKVLPRGKLLGPATQPGTSLTGRPPASWTAKFGSSVVAQLYLDATSKPTGFDTKGQQRSPAGEFVHLAIGLEREQALGERTAQAAAFTGDRVLRQYQTDILRQISTGGNYLVTEIIPHHAATLLERNHNAKTVVLAPTINLADQQAAYIRTSPPFNSFRFGVDCFCGGKSVNPEREEWVHLLKRSSVVVLTPAILQNLIERGAACFEDITLLVLDECHNAVGGSAMAVVLKRYAEWLEARTMSALDLLQNRLKAQYLVVPDDHPEVLAHVPQAQDQRIVVRLREEDRVFAESLGRWVLGALDLLGTHLQGLAAAGSDDEEPEGGLPADLHLRYETLQQLALGQFSNAAEEWCARAAKHVEAAQGAEPALKTDLNCCVMLLSEALGALSVAGNMGCEAAARRLAQLVAETVQKLLGVRTEELLGRPVARNDSASGSAGGSGSGDVEGVAMELLRLLTRQVLGQDTLEEAYRNGIFACPKSPKYIKMKEVLLQYRDQKEAHGIVFIRTRADCRVLHSILQADPDLGFMQLHLLMGHGGRGIDGMAVKQQREARESFGAKGQHLLIATAAAEEGLNIPACQFVIRFNATQTGRELLQSKGRIRTQDGVYFELVEEGTLEERLANKSAQQARNLHLALHHHLKAFHI
ncbi:hypothetical protein CHLNCDRAFT_135022 [Chlorella variabilis]|uniref:Uncharacterized protein n=1 Tax=Chlorella variabilis TaxID=554065 RepID=E1ZHD7_CHLVA|nr:hypothetical protein CHLNCDRAFT_135022 [Chlorella variabilis]EFN55105.1 hypothetical protein CHLNCDRAFT_135022 [Chlorella variabilis]|eukprot:XP_005847207.1 hypothetical protein CHLNCDRAFT_135022 [Chlorella variabilis]